MATVLDAGYYHIRSSSLPLESTITLHYALDTAFLFQLENESALPGKTLDGLRKHGEVVTFKTANRPQASYVLFRPNPLASPATISAEGITSASELQFLPTATELMTLEYGLQRYGTEAANLSITVDDTGLPSGLNNHLSMLLPESYQTLLQSSNFSKPFMISERVCRNKGFHKVTHKKPDADSRVQLVSRDSLERQTDCTTGECSVGNSYLVSDVIRRESMELKGCGGVMGAVALSRPGNVKDGESARDVPSCGVIIAGLIGQLIDHGYNKIITVHHRKDDKELPRKNMDGMAIGAWLWPKKELMFTSVQLFSKPGAKPLATVQPYSFQLFNEGRDPRLLDEKYAGRK